MNENERKAGDTIDLMEHRAMVLLPENAVEVTVTCNVYYDGAIIQVSKVMDLSDIRAAFEKADSGYIDDDDRFVITEKGMKLLEERKNK